MSIDLVDLSSGLSWCARWHLWSDSPSWICTQELTIGSVHRTWAVTLALSRSTTVTGGVATSSLFSVCAVSLHLQQQSTVCLCTIAPSWAASTPPTGVTASGCMLPLSTSPLKRTDVGRRGVQVGGSSLTCLSPVARLGVCTGMLWAVSRWLVMHTRQ